MKLANILKKLLLGIVLSTLPLFAFSATSANQPTVRQVRVEIQEKRAEMRAEIKEKRETFQNEAKDRVEALKKHFGEARAKRIEGFFNNMVRKFENAIDRLDALADRIKNHLDKLADQDKDTAELNLKLDVAKNKITDAENSLSDAKAKFDAMSLSSDPKQSFKDVKILVQNVAKKIKEAHAALVDVINSMKDASDKATTTPTQ